MGWYHFKDDMWYNNENGKSVNEKDIDDSMDENDSNDSEETYESEINPAKKDDK